MKFAYEATGRPKLEAVCSKDKTRPALTEPYLRVDPKDKGRGVVAATNSYALVALPVEFDDDEQPTDGFLPLTALKAKTQVGPRVRGDEVLIVDDGTVHKRPDYGQFPNWEQLMPDHEDLSDFKIGFSAKLLWELAQAMGTDGVVLEFNTAPGTPAMDKDGNAWRAPANIRSIRVWPLGRRVGTTSSIVDGPLGILMPIRLAGE
jgi:hypothetical protein